ncbi:AI-2E family transporter, partial [Candidatus Falkowbacteria bacterium]|nr:AI-2E family transporter [Candidatus Falkowbacteria bacterium]
LSSVIIMAVTALMLAATLEPIVYWLHKKLSIGLAAAAAIIMVVLVLPLVVVILALAPTFVNQSTALVKFILSMIEKYRYLAGFMSKIDFSQYTAQGGQYIIDTTAQFTTFMVELTVMLFMTFYILVDSKRLHDLFLMAIPSDVRAKSEKLLKEMAVICGQYIRGNIIISVICTATIYLCLSLLKVPSALPLAIFAGIMDLLPNIGATIGTIPAVILAFTVSPFVGFMTLACFMVYQTVENNILAPNIYNKTLHLIPFLNFVAVIIGTMLMGVAGAFLALPIAASLQAVIKFFYDNDKPIRKYKKVRAS